MIALVGLSPVALHLSAQGPIANLEDHLADPGVNNGFASATKFV